VQANAASKADYDSDEKPQRIGWSVIGPFPIFPEQSESPAEHEPQAQLTEEDS
jgi:hypothetical protein